MKRGRPKTRTYEQILQKRNACIVSWRIRMLADGKCRNCGQVREDLQVLHCDACRRRMSEQKRQRRIGLALR